MRLLILSLNINIGVPGQDKEGVGKRSTLGNFQNLKNPVE